MLKPQDVVIILKLVALEEREWKYSELALELCMSPSEVHGGIRRLKKCGLVAEFSMGIGSVVQKKFIPDVAALKEFLHYGIRYIFPSVYSEPAKGLPTSYGVEHLFKGFDFTGGFIPVWEMDVGDYFGAGIKPLYPSVPKAAMNDFRLYEYLALTDALRSDDEMLRNFAWGKMDLMLGA